jgi:hypothetical protein
MSIKALALAAGLLLAAQPKLSAADAGQSAAGRADSFPFCAWWAETTATSLNVAFPDTSATYWTTPLLASQDLVSVTVNGQYLNARYFSLNTYTNGGASYTCGTSNTPSGLADYLIAPDSGSLNPFQVSAAPGGQYTVTLARTGASTPAPNTIPLYQSSSCQPAPSQGPLPSTLSFLILRVYLPQNGFNAVVLPDLTLNFSDKPSVTLPQCPRRQTPPAQSRAAGPLAGVSPAVASDWKAILSDLLAAEAAAGAEGPFPPPCGRPGAAACPPELTFFRPTNSATGGLFPDEDNKYIAAIVRPKPETVVVIRAKAATFTPGMQAAPWNPQATNLRYWSMCSNIYRPPYPVVVDEVGDQTILGCAPDLDTAQDGSGFYTYVISYVRDKPSDAALSANSATWLPFSNTHPLARHLLTLRNMLGADFPPSVQNCTAGGDLASITACQESMAAYYPTAAECAVRTFETGGTAACFQEAQLAQRE